MSGFAALPRAGHSNTARARSQTQSRTRGVGRSGADHKHADHEHDAFKGLLAAMAIAVPFWTVMIGVAAAIF